MKRNHFRGGSWNYQKKKTQKFQHNIRTRIWVRTYSHVCTVLIRIRTTLMLSNFVSKADCLCTRMEVSESLQPYFGFSEIQFFNSKPLNTVGKTVGMSSKGYSLVVVLPSAGHCKFRSVNAFLCFLSGIINFSSSIYPFS